MTSFNLFHSQDKENWKTNLENFPKNKIDIYYTPEYYSLNQNYNGGQANCFVFKKNKNIALYPFLMNSVNNLGYDLNDDYYDIQGAYGYNGVLSTSYSPSFINDFYQTFDNFCLENNIIAEFTRFNPILNNEKFSAAHLNIIYDRKTVFLDLTQDFDTIWKNEYSSNNRNMIRKAEKFGVESFISQKKSDYDLFFKLYRETMQNVRASDYYFFNDKYFDDLQSILKNKHYLLISTFDGAIVGGMILFIEGDYAHYHLSARKKELGKYAINNHCLNEAIKFAQQNGCKFFHFGGGTSSNDNDPLLKFKSNFSKQNRNFYIGKKIHNENIYIQVLKQWKEKHSSSFLNNKNRLLGYREIQISK